MHTIIKENLVSHVDLINSFDETLISTVENVSTAIIECFKRGNKVLICGNGGSAADAQHISAELVGRFVKERKPLPSIALTTDTSAITAIGNDYNFEAIFERQVDALAHSTDILIGISTSGNSKNILRAIEKANTIGCITIGLSGRDGGKMNSICKYNIIVPSDVTARIQEAHILIGHIICTIVDQNDW
jgi:D-sedoheptulose 7-phosphate isomerase